MKNNTTKVILGAALLLCAAACKPDLDFAIPADKIGFFSKETLVETSIFNEGFDLSVIKSGKGTSAAKVELELGTAADIDAYNAKDPSFHYVAADPSSYKMPENLVLEFAAGDTRKSARITWEIVRYFYANEGSEAVIPVRIKNSSIDVDSTRTLLLVKPFISKVSFADITEDANDIKNIYTNVDDLVATDSYNGRAQIMLDKAVASRDVTAKLKVDNKLIAATAEKRGKEYIAAPNGFFKLDAPTVTIKAGELYAEFSYSIDYSKLFDSDGDPLYDEASILIPIVISGTEEEGISVDKSLATAFVVFNISESMSVTPPTSPSKDFTGPWDVIEGEEFDMAHDPNIESDWYKMYCAPKLVDGNFHYYDGTMGLWFWTENVFPVHFVFNLGQSYIFKGFRLVDAKTHQNNFRHLRVYVAREYVGADTNWILACEGTRKFNGGWQSWPADDGSKESLDEKFTYHMPEDSDPEQTNSFTYTKGQFVKLEIVEPTRTTGDYINGRGYLQEFFINGWEL